MVRMIAMDLQVFQDENEAARAASAWAAERVKRAGAQALFVPAGGTPVPLYRLWEKERPKWLESLDLLQVDEVLSEPGRGQFLSFLKKELPTYTSQIVPVDHSLPKGPVIAVLGLGVNGHIAFHEPGLPESFQKGEVALSAETCRNLGLPAGARGLSYGAGVFLDSASILLLVTGEKKAQVLRDLLKGNTTLPASFLLSHRDLTVIADRKAAGNLGSDCELN
jgi:6-phosphogluconolactonase/glucosamine-6-phosphate isomerase/deaminase